MLKYKSIIEKMSVRQKVALLSEFLSRSDKQTNQTGIPAIKTAELSSLACECADFPSFESAAYSWDISLMELMVGELASRARGQGANLIVTPDLKCIVNPYLQGLSEDPVLNGAIAAGMSRAVHYAGAGCALNAFEIQNGHTEYLDLQQNPVAIHEFFEKPFLYANEEAPCDAVVTSLNPLESGSSYSNADFFRSAVGGRLGELFAIGESVPNDVDFHQGLSHGVYLGGSGLILDRALGRYKQLTEYREEGSITEREVQGALDDGSAIEESMLDESVDKLIDFAFRVNQIPPTSRNVVPAAEIGLKVAQESIVLLKNEGILPIVNDKRIAVFGDVYEDFHSGLNIVGAVKGFAPDSLQDALQMAGQADILLVFFASDSEKRQLRLSKHRIALLKALHRTGRPVIAVLKGSMPIDMSFDKSCAAVLVAPNGSRHCTAALSDVLTGKVNPSGKLTRTYHDYADEYFRTLKIDKDEGKTRVGPFVGYRYYDTAGKKVRYPFGFGLSYTEFAYSDLQLNGDEVSFTLKNVGKRDGCEIAQVYIGRNTKSDVVPRKELKAFIRVALQAGESRRVTLTLPQSKYASFDSRIMSETIEEGSYTVFVGASVKDIRLKGMRVLKGEQRPKTDARPSDYFRDLTNLDRAAAKGQTVERSLPARIKLLYGVGLIGLFAALLATFITGYIMLNKGETSPGGLIGVSFSIVMVLGAIALLIGEKKYRKNLLKSEMEAYQRLKQKSEETKAPNDLFAAPVGQVTKDGAQQVGSADEPQYFDREQTFETVCRDLKLFSAERGLLIEENHLRNILAAFTASQLLIVPGKSIKQLNKFCEILGEYFGSGTYADNAETYIVSSDLFQRRNNFWAEKTQLALCLEEARSARPYLHVALLRHVTRRALEEAFVAIAQKLDNLPSDAGDKSLIGVYQERQFPPNVRIIAALAEGERFEDIPPSVAEVAAVLDPVFEECEISTEKTLVKPFGYYQFCHLRKIVREQFPLEERFWKRVDRLEERIGEENGYRIGNRLLVKMERHMSTFLACGGDMVDALDAAVATELLARVLFMIQPKNEDEEVINVLEEVLASSDLMFCSRFFSEKRGE